MRLHSEIENDALGEATVVRVEVIEGLSQLFEIDFQVSVADPDLDLEALLSSDTWVHLVTSDAHQKVRTFHGVVEEAAFLKEGMDSRFVYGLKLRPRMFGLSHRVRTRIFQESDVPTIVKAVFQGAGLPDESVRWNLSRDYPVREFCLQYQESELDFVLRLFEDEGIFFRFVHEESGHVLEVLDDASVHAPIEGDPVLPFSTWSQDDRELVADLLFSQQIYSDAYSARDWDWKRPSDPLEGAQEEEGTAGFETYEYPGGFLDSEIGGRRALDRLKASGVDRYTLEGQSSSLRLVPGCTFEVAGAQPSFLDREYLLTQVRWIFLGVDDAQTRASLRVGFQAIPSDQVFRPPRETPRPRVWGRESGVICGPPGEEIHVDEHGRVRVHFYWDREGSVDDKAACWMRVQQLNTDGSMLLPRVGWEVDIGFLDGDPDRPVVLQKLYNQDTMPPYGLPGAKTQSSLQSSSSPGGGGTNELRMEDGGGGMQLGIHASRDMSIAVDHDLGEHVTVNVDEQVGTDLSTRVGADETITIVGDQHQTVTGKQVEAVGGAREVSVTGMDDWGIKGNFTLACDADRADTLSSLMSVLAGVVDENFSADHSRTIGAALTIGSAMSVKETVGGKKTETIAGARLETITKAKSEKVSKSKALTAAAMKVKTGENVAVSSGGPLAITVGGTWVEKCGEGFSIAGDTIRVVASGGVDFKVGGTSLKASGSTLQLKASTLGVKGAMAVKLKGKINYEK